jgi:hypothetical protein
MIAAIIQSTFPEASAPEQISGTNNVRPVGAATPTGGELAAAPCSLSFSPMKTNKRKNGNVCLFCNSRKSIYRIVTANLGYDEVSCSKHVHDLEAHADDTLGERTVKRWHISSSGGVKRGEANKYIQANAKRSHEPQ